MATMSSRTCVGSRRVRGGGRSTRASAPAFTLVELLVVVAIIGALVGILVPTLGAAKSAARDTVCQANLKTLAAGWHAYGADKDRFPTEGRTPREDPPYGGAWGGQLAYRNPNGRENPRIINAYLGEERLLKSKFQVFECPKDTMPITVVDPQPIWRLLPDSFLANYRNDDFKESLFALQGNSYYANDWVWAEVGSVDGAGPTLARHWKHDNPLGLIRHPDRTLMLADATIHAAPLTPGQRRENGLWVAWWHGPDAMQGAFWDGSARRVPVRRGGWSSDYWLWLQPEAHPPEGTPIARLNTVRNPTRPGG